jgi:predicted small lipoprotein YifL
MKAISRAVSMTLGAGILGAVFVSNAVAACGDLSSLKGPLKMADPDVVARAFAPKVESANPDQHGGGSGASIVGFWKIQLISKGNTSHNPSIPDGALIDFGYTQWHSDGTEIQNSAGVPGGGFCLGVWGQTGFLTFELNHFPIAFDPTTGEVANYVNIREQNTLSPSGDSYTGTFTEDVFDVKGIQVDHVGGTVVATRMTVDTAFPSAIPNQ